MNNIFSLYDFVIYTKNLIITINNEDITIKKNSIKCKFNILSLIAKDYINHSINYDMVLSVKPQTLKIDIPLNIYKDNNIREFYYLDNDEYNIDNYTSIKGLKRNLIPIKLNNKMYYDNINRIVKEIVEEGFGCSEKQVPSF